MTKSFEDIFINWDFEDSDEILYSWGSKKNQTFTWDRTNLYDGEYFEFRPYPTLLVYLERDKEELIINIHEVGSNIFKN